MLTYKRNGARIARNAASHALRLLRLTLGTLFVAQTTTVDSMPTDAQYATRLGSAHQSGFSAVSEFVWNACDACCTQLMIGCGPKRLPTGRVDCLCVQDNGSGMSQATMKNSLLRLGQNRDVQHGPHSLNGHGAKKACEHLGDETMYLSKTDDCWAVGRMGASTNDLSIGNDLSRMTNEFASLDEVAALMPDDPIFYKNPFCTTGAQLRTLLEEIQYPTGTTLLIANRHAGTGFKTEGGRLEDVERDWADIRAKHLPKAPPVSMDLAALIARATPPACMYDALRAAGFVAGKAPGAGVDVFVANKQVDVAALNPFDRAAAASAVKPALVTSEDGRFAFTAVWSADAGESGLVVFADAKNLGIVPGHGGNRTFGKGATGLTGMDYTDVCQACTDTRCRTLAAQMEEAGAPGGMALEAMLSYGSTGGGGRELRQALYDMYCGRGAYCLVAAKPRVLKSDDPKETVAENTPFKEGEAFARKALLCFTAKHPSPDPEITKLLKAFQCYAGLTVAEVKKAKDEAAKKANAEKAAAAYKKHEERRKAEAEAAAKEEADKAQRDAANKAKREQDNAVAKLNEERLRQARAQKAAETERKNQEKAAAKAAAEAAKERENNEMRAKMDEMQRQLAAAKAAEAAAAAAAPIRVPIATISTGCAPITTIGGRTRAALEPTHSDAVGASRGAPRPRLGAAAPAGVCAGICASRIPVLEARVAELEGHVTKLKAFIQGYGLQPPPGV